MQCGGGGKCLNLPGAAFDGHCQAGNKGSPCQDGYYISAISGDGQNVLEGMYAHSRVKGAVASKWVKMS